jgi:hypothetical protein
MRMRSLLVSGFAAALLVSTGGVAHANPGTILPATPMQNSGTDGRAYDVIINNGIAYVGGTFNNTVGYDGANPQPHANMAAFNIANGSVVPTFNANTNGTVWAVISDGASLYIGGDFTLVNGTKAVRVAKLNLATGAVEAFAGNANNTVRGLAVSGSRLYMAGFFAKVNGEAKKFAAALDKNSGALDRTFAPNPDQKAHTVEISDTGRVFYGGKFTTIGGAGHPGISEVNPATGEALGPEFKNFGGIVLDLALPPGVTQVFASTQTNFAIAFNSATGARQWRWAANGDMQAIEYLNGNVYFGFHDGFQGNTTYRIIGADAATGNLEGFAPIANGLKGVLGIATNGSKLVVAGDFNRMQGVRDWGVAIFG